RRPPGASGETSPDLLTVGSPGVPAGDVAPPPARQERPGPPAYWGAAPGLTAWCRASPVDGLRTTRCGGSCSSGAGDAPLGAHGDGMFFCPRCRKRRPPAVKGVRGSRRDPLQSVALARSSVMRRAMMFVLSVPVLILMLVSALAQEKKGDAKKDPERRHEQFGEVHFPVDCKAGVQEKFDLAVA